MSPAASIIYNPSKHTCTVVGCTALPYKDVAGMVREFTAQQSITDFSCIEQEKVKAFYEYLETRPLKLRPGSLSLR